MTKGQCERKTQVEWYMSELRTLRLSYAKSTRAEIQELIPRHTLKAIDARAFKLGLRKGRFEYVKRPECHDPLLLSLFEFMRKHNLSADDVGQEVLGGGSTIRYWAKGQHSPKLKYLRKVLEYLGLELRLVETARAE